MSFSVSCFTTGCNPTHVEHHIKTLPTARKRALGALDHIKHRAFAAGNTVEIDGTEEEFDKVRELISNIKRVNKGHSVEVGPTPDGYNIRIANNG